MKRPPFFCSLLGTALLFLGPTQTHGASGGPWQNGDVFTRTQNAWDATTSWYAAYSTIYAPTSGIIEVGIPGTSGYSLTFTSAPRVSDYFVQAGVPAALNADLIDPTSSVSGQFGGEVLALRMNVDFSAAGALGGSVNFGTLHLCNMTDPSFNGMTVNDILAIANTLLGGGSSTYTIQTITNLVVELNNAFLDGVPSTFAQNNLVAGYCPCSQWQNGDGFTRTQFAWDSTTSWYAAYNTIYASSSGIIEVGIPGSSGYSLLFSSPTKVSNFFIQTGTPAALNADLVDTTSSPSGQFGGEVLALRMNIDFSAAGALGGSVNFGSLHLCAMTDASFNGMTVTDILAIANTLLGGGSSAYTIITINDVSAALNAAFIDGVPSSFASAHLVNGPCPGPQTGVPSFIVTTISDHDDGSCNVCDCTLREAINAANATAGDNIITFAPAVLGTIQLTSLLPDVTTNISIVGPGARLLAVSGNGAKRVFNFAGGTTCSVSSLTIANGFVSGVGLGASVSGGGIFNQGNLTLTNCTLSGNVAQGGSAILAGSGGSGSGGAIYNSGALAVSRCTFNNNIATGGNGANAGSRTPPGNGGSGNGGALFDDRTLTLTNCTFSGNTGTGGTGGNGNSFGGNGGNGYGGVFNQGTLTVTACTLSGNSGAGALGGSGGSNPGLDGTGTGGLAQSSGGGSTTVRNTISAANGATGTNAAEDVSGNFNSTGYNLIGRRRNATGFGATGDQVGEFSPINPQLGTLQNNGGSTDTRALLSNSPAINSGDPNAPSQDQRYYLRSGVPDIGAFEFSGALAPMSGVSRKTHGTGGPTFDINLPLTGPVGVECRRGQGTNSNDHQVIMTFPVPVTVGSASATPDPSPTPAATGSVSNFSVNGSQVTVNLTGVSNAQRFTITLTNVNDGTNTGTLDVSMGVLLGDVNATGALTNADVSVVKAQVAAGGTVGPLNFKNDVNANGAITNADVSVTKAQVAAGAQLP